MLIFHLLSKIYAKKKAFFMKKKDMGKKNGILAKGSGKQYFYCSKMFYFQIIKME